MGDPYDWPSFHEALRTSGPKLLIGLDEETREIVTIIASSTDRFWSDGLEDMLAQGALDGDLRGGVLMTLELWRENVLTALSDDFSMEFDWSAISIDAESPLVAKLVQAARPSNS